MNRMPKTPMAAAVINTQPNGPAGLLGSLADTDPPRCPQQYQWQIPARRKSFPLTATI